MTDNSDSGFSKQLVALMFTDLVGSVAMQQRLGTEAYMRYVARHDDVFQECLTLVPSAQILNETGDGFLVRFADPSEAVNTALRLQYRMDQEEAEGQPFAIRIGLHLGAVTEMEEKNRGVKRAVGMPINLTARIMDLGEGGQILMTRAVYEDARNYVRDHPPIGEHTIDRVLEWKSHGLFEFKGNPEPLAIFEVGVPGIAPLIPPESGGKAKRIDQSEAPSLADTEVFSVESIQDSDVAIIHAPVDDQPLVPGQPGWISQFHNSLEIMIEQLSGEPVKVWRDAGPDTEERSSQIRALLPSVKTMVPVLSPPFVRSPNCVSEVESFCRASDAPSHPRLVKAVKMPVAGGELPPELSGPFSQLPDFEFYERDSDSGRLRGFDTLLDEDAKRRYFDRVSDVAYEVCELLKGQKGGNSSRAQLPANDGKTVYLAETTSDLQVERDRLRRELLERGHRVVPEQALPLQCDQLETAVREHLNESDVAVHLVGNRYGMIPEDADRSMVDLQNFIAAESCTNGNRERLRRLIWMPRDVQPNDDRQAAFVAALEEDPASHIGGEVIRDTLPNLKMLLLEILDPKPAPTVEPAVSEQAVETPTTVYFVYDSRDEESIEPIEDHLFDSGFEVLTPLFEGEVDQISQVHREHLKRCDGVLVYYGTASKPWVETTLMDVLRAPGYGRERPVRAQTVYVAPPEDRRKTRYRTHLAEIVRQEGPSFDPQVLNAFVSKLTQYKV